MGLSVSEVGAPRTYLEAVQKLMGGCGLDRATSLDGADRNTTRAMEAVQSALYEIWYEAQWDFRFKWGTHELVAKTMWYELPEDFDQPGTECGVHKQVWPITYKHYEWLLEQYPYIRNIPAEFSDSSLTDEADEIDHSGQTGYWTIKGGYLGLVPAPSADHITATSDKVVYGYYKHFVEPVEGGDELGISRELYPAHHYIALGQFKQMLEWSDFKVSEDRGRFLLAKQTVRHQKKYFGDSQLI